MSRKETNPTPVRSSGNGGEQDRDAQKREFAKQLLDSYFMFRSPLPREGYFQENKRTLDIMDELSPMMVVPTDDVVAYMMEHDYSCTTEQDGTVSWAIWRQL